MSGLLRILRLDFACFEKIHDSGAHAEEISQLDICADFLDRSAYNVCDYGESVRYLSALRFADSLIGIALASGCSAAVDYAASDRSIWNRLVDRFQGQAICARVGDCWEPSVHGVGSFAPLDSPAFFLER